METSNTSTIDKARINMSGATEVQPETAKHGPWGTGNKAQVTSLHDIMSEQLAEEIQWKQIQRISDTDQPKEYRVQESSLTADCDNDRAIAAALQEQFDKEHQQQLKRRDMQRNGLYKYQVHQPAEEDWGGNNIKYNDDDEDREAFVWKCAAGTGPQEERAALPRRGAVLKDGKLITKHDEALSARINGSKLMNLPGMFIL